MTTTQHPNYSDRMFVRCEHCGVAFDSQAYTQHLYKVPASYVCALLDARS